MVVNLEDMLGVDPRDPADRLAAELVAEDEQMLDSLVRLRESSMTQTEVGRAMGISQSAVARIESGARDPHLSTLRRYAFAVGAVIRHEVHAVHPDVQHRFLPGVQEMVDEDPERPSVHWGYKPHLVDG